MSAIYDGFTLEQMKDHAMSQATTIGMLRTESCEHYDRICVVIDERNTLQRLNDNQVATIEGMLSQQSALETQIAEHAETVNMLRKNVDESQGRATLARMEHERDIALIGEMLLKAADRNNLCDVYDREIAAINEQLDRYYLPTREREYNVEVEYTVRFTTTVTAHNESEAEESAQSDINEDYVFTVPNGAWNVDYSHMCTAAREG